MDRSILVNKLHSGTCITTCITGVTSCHGNVIFLPTSIIHQICSPLTHYQTTKLKYFADDNFKFDENGRKLSKQVENTVGKGEIARYEQQCFQKACFPGASKCVIVWEWVNLQLPIMDLF